MNLTYRLIWSDISNTWVAVSEATRTRGKRGVSCAVLLLAATAAFAAPPAANQLPTGGQVSAGNAAIQQSGAVMNINQTTQRAAVNWNTFDVGSAAQVNFNQPSASSVTLNRVLDSNPSQIFGRITAPGQVFLTNPNGVYFAPGAVVDVGGLTATTHTISDTDFMAGLATFSRNGATGSIINQGELKAALGGYVALLAPEVRNEGVIVAQAGTVALAAGDTITLNFGANNSLAGLTVTASQIKALVENKQAILAPDGLIILSALAADSLQGSVVNNTGVLEAASLTSKGGRIILEGDDITLTLSSQMDASGATGGGTVLVGGDWQGSGTMHQATNVTMEQGAIIDASATQQGDGGKVVLWSDVHNINSQTTVHGSIMARGGVNGGNGGQVETSGHNVNMDAIRVNAGADNGMGGLWLIDPYSYTIGSSQASAIVGDISSGLNSGTSVTVDTALNNSSYGSSGNVSDAGDITVSAAINKTLGGDATLTLKAARHVSLQSGATINSSSGKLNLQLWADSDNSGDGIIQLASSSISTNGGWLKFGNNQSATINGSSVLVGGDVFFNGASAQTLSTGGGNLNIFGETILANPFGITINTSGGNVTFSGVLNSGNQYTWVDKTTDTGHDWNWARTDAKNGTAGGSALNDSYLVTITSRLENAIAGLTAGYRGAWIGAYRANPTSSFAWTWADGPEAGVQFFTQNSSGGGGTTTGGYYSNYGLGEPNGTLAANESVGQFFGTAGQWNDLSQTTTFSATQGSPYNVLGYVRETNLAPTTLTINAGSGIVEFNNSVGGSKALASLTVSGASTLPNSVTTIGAQTYNGAVQLVADTTLTTTNSDISFGSTVDSADAANPKNLTTNILADPTYYWVDWTSSDATHVYGTITIGGSTIDVTYSNPNGFYAAQTSGGINYWTGLGGAAFVGASPFVSANVANGPASSDIIKLQYQGSQTLTFSQSVENLAFSIVSMNGNGYEFDQNFDIASYSGYNGAGAGYYGGGTMVKVVSGSTYQLNDGGMNASSVDHSEPHGTIRFTGGFSQLTWESLSNEIWNAFTVGVSGTSATAGTVHFNGTVAGSAVLGAVTVNGAMQTTADIIDASSLSVTGNSNLGGNVTTSGDQNYGSAVTLSSNATLTTTSNGSVTTTSTINGAHNLTVSTNGTGDTTFNGAVGSSAALTGLNVTTDVLNAGAIALAASAALDITNGGSSLISGVISGTDATLAKADSGTLTLTANSTYNGATNINAGELILQNDAPTTSSSSFNGPGTLIIQPSSNSFGGTFSTNGWSFGSTLGGLTIGKSTNTAGVTLANATSIAGPIDIYGGAIAVDANLTSAAISGIGISLNGSSVTQAAGVAVATGGANIEYLVTNSPVTANNDYAINLNGASGSRATINANGGDVTLDATFATLGTAGSGDVAVRAFYADITTTGIGAISITGDATNNSNTSANAWGMYLGYSTIKTQSGAIDITGIGGKSSSNAIGIVVNGADLKILSSSGQITLKDQTPAGLTGSYSGLYFNPTASDDIIIGADGSTVLSSTSNITISADKVSFLANGSYGTQLNTTGVIVIESNATSFGSAVNLTNLALASNPSSVRIGKTTNTAAITLGNITAAGPIDIYGGNIIVNGGLSAIGTNTISLTATGSMTEGASGFISADMLALLGGNVTLTNASNAIGTLAASGVSGLTYTDSDALTIGTVGSTIGVSATGVVSIGTASGDLTLTQNVDTTNTTSSALILNAGINTAAGTATGGNIVVSGSPIVSVGAGGTTKLYSGNVSGSTGLTALVGSGSGRFRYNSDESVANFTQILSTGLNAIYREQPTISSVAVNDQSITYGDALPTWTFDITGSQNGDTLAQVFSSGPTVTISGTTSTSGNYTAGTSHTLTASGSLDPSLLGYASTAGSYTTGALTVGQKTLNVIYTGDNKTYDGGTSATVTTSDDRVTNDVLTISSTTNFVDKNAANSVAINISGSSLSDTDADNYILASTTGSTTANIGKKVVTLSAAKTYDGTTDLTGNVSIGTGVSGETLTYAGAMASDAHVATVNKYISAITLADQSGATSTSGGLASNYQLPALDADNAPVTINTKALSGTASIGGTLTKIYDGTTGVDNTTASLSGSIGGAVSGDTISLDTIGVTLAYNSSHVVGANSILTSGSAGFNIDSSTHGSAASDYSFSTPSIASATANITPETLTLSLTNTGVNKTYDGTMNAPAGFVPAWSVAGLIMGDTAADVSNTTAAYNSKNVLNANKITVSGTDLTVITGSLSSATSDYVLASTSVDVAATIIPVTLSLSAAKTYDGTTDLTGNVSIGTGVSGETLTYAGAMASDAHVATANKYISAITLADQSGATSTSGGLASNYQLPTLDADNAPVTINTHTLNITANNDSKTFDALPYSGGNGLTYAGFVVGESEIDLSGALTYGGNSQGAVNTGNYLISPLGLSSNNYAITFFDGVLVISSLPTTPPPPIVDSIILGMPTHAMTESNPALPESGGLNEASILGSSISSVGDISIFGVDGVEVTLERKPDVSFEGIVAVSIPEKLVYEGSSFSIPLPVDIVKEGAGDKVVLTRPDGSAVPNWLSYNAVKRAIEVHQMPIDGLPIKIIVIAGDKRTVVMITEKLQEISRI